MKKILWFLILIFIVACSTTPKIPIKAPRFSQIPAMKNSNIKDLSSNPTDLYAKKYFIAKKNLESGQINAACESWEELIESSEFPLGDLVTVFYLENCSVSKSRLKKFLKLNEGKKYFKEDFLNLAIKEVRKFEMSETLSQLLYEFADYKKSNKEKIIFLEEALKIAREESSDDSNSFNQSILEKLKKLSPSIYSPINSENKFNIAKDFESKRDFDKAQAIYQEIINGESEIDQKEKAFNAYRMSFKVNRDLKAFLEKTKEMEAFFFNLTKESNSNKRLNEIWNESAINLARALWTEHLNAEAQSVLDKILETKLCNLNQCSLATFIKAQIALEEKDYPHALKFLKEALKFDIKDANLKENIQWNLIFNSYLVKKYKDIEKLAPKFYKNHSNINFSSKLKYWHGKALQKLHKNTEADKIFQELLDFDSFNYYGILSSMELNSPLPALSNFVPPLIESGDNTFDWLLALDEKKFAQDYLKQIDSKFKTYKERENAYQYYYHTNWYQGALRQIYYFTNEKRNEITAKYSHLIYPYPYYSKALEMSKKYNVPVEYIFSIIRQESSFVPTERSWADAFGLMQLTPESAKKISKDFSIPFQNIEELYDPETNIQLGVALLKSLRSKFNGKFIHSTAAYNASEDAINKWQTERFNGDYFEFIELIPYEETRNYIKLVFRNYVTYKRILKNESFLLEKDFFEKEFN